ncbi:PDZ domain-containing protein [Sphingomonas turrisvirgatae]|uniref:PDZ domain-containing protein n=1 Tax=Sphingomonas turrisvirgatae TaxID=1888892 RepID=A0A1E3LVF3_9SPHN|nr:hypothetical protein [Sphingomonas turrisvirgatae]ODP37726.1 hypothetical protein BFL28_01760 [Sphingomonas turrisvirgatae]
MGIAPVAAQVMDGRALDLLRQADMKLAGVGYRMSVAAAPLCDRLEPGTGLQLHTLGQYDAAGRPAVRDYFKMAGTVGVEGVVPGSPAHRAGVQQDDTIVSIAGIVPSVEFPPGASTAMLAKLHLDLAERPWQQPLKLVIRRDGTERTIEIQPIAACFTRYEVKISDRFEARADGELVQISSRHIEDLPPDLLPATVAHELAHNILRHRERLSAAGAEFGLASGFGRNVGLFRRAELEADILSVHLLARAGYPPELGARFWQEAGSTIMGGLIRSRSHPPAKDRAAAMAAEAARIRRAGGKATAPPFYAERGANISSNWRALLAREL